MIKLVYFSYPFIDKFDQSSYGWWPFWLHHKIEKENLGPHWFPLPMSSHHLLIYFRSSAMPHVLCNSGTFYTSPRWDRWSSAGSTFGFVSSTCNVVQWWGTM
jgi:hypothetical protein